MLIKSFTAFFFLDANEQFDIFFFFSILTNVNMYFFLLFVCVISISDKLTSHCGININLLVQSVYFFIKGTVANNISSKNAVVLQYLPYFFVVFFFVVFSNMIGLVTFTYTVTSLVVVPFFLSVINFVFTSFIMVKKLKLSFLGGFLPVGTNLAIAPLLILIEVISYFIKLISLAVRLFANMFAGHILIKVLLSLVWTLAVSNLFAGVFLAFLIFILIGAILCLELFICGLQAYVFVNLASVYLDQALNFLNH